MSEQRFVSLKEAEDFLKSQGFSLVADSCDWKNSAGDDAGCYTVEGLCGQVKGFRVVINRRVTHTDETRNDD